MGANTLSPQQQAQDKVEEGIRESFGQLTQTAVAKSDTLDVNTAIIAALTNTITNLTATNAILAATAAKASGTSAIHPPPGFTSAGIVSVATVHALNLAGIAFPTNNFRGRTLFVVPQHCAICSRWDP